MEYTIQLVFGEEKVVVDSLDGHALAVDEQRLDGSDDEAFAWLDGRGWVRPLGHRKKCARCVCSWKGVSLFYDRDTWEGRGLGSAPPADGVLVEVRACTPVPHVEDREADVWQLEEVHVEVGSIDFALDDQVGGATGINQSKRERQRGTPLGEGGVDLGKYLGARVRSVP